MCVSTFWVLLLAATGLWGAQGDLEIPLCCADGQNFGGKETVGEEARLYCNATSDPFVKKFEPLKNLSTHHHPLICPSSIGRLPIRLYIRRNITVGEQIQKLLLKSLGTDVCLDFTERSVFLYFCFTMPKTPEVPGVNWRFTLTCGLSVVLLLITAIIYSTVRPLTTNPHSPYIVAHNLALAMSYVSRICLQFVPISDKVPECQYIAFVLQFSTMAAFFWMSAMCFDVHITIRDMLDDDFVPPAQDFRRMQPTIETKSPCNKKFVFLSLYAWGIPLIITITAICLEFLDAVSSDSPFKPNIALWRFSCFFVGPSRWYLFKAPIAVSVVLSVTLFIATAVGLYQHEKNMTSRAQRNSKFLNDKRCFFLYLKLFVIMGVSWGFSWAVDAAIKLFLSYTGSTLPSYFSYMYAFMDLIFCLQGIFIFMLFVCKKRTLKILMEQFQSLQFLRCSSRKSQDSSSTAGDHGINSAESKETIL